MLCLGSSIPRFWEEGRGGGGCLLFHVAPAVEIVQAFFDFKGQHVLEISEKEVKMKGVCVCVMKKRRERICSARDSKQTNVCLYS